MTDANYADDLGYHANTPSLSLLHSLERAMGSIGLNVNTDKMCFNQEGTISTFK